MQLTQFTDYSLRTLMYLAEHPDKLCTIGEIAEWYGVSKPHLVKVVHNLAKLGYIKSVQGKGGGIALNKPISEINIGHIVRDTEPNFNMVECFDKKNNTCKITNNCKLKHVLYGATESFLNMLDQHTLGSVCSNSNYQP